MVDRMLANPCNTYVIFIVVFRISRVLETSLRVVRRSVPLPTFFDRLATRPRLPIHKRFP